MSTKLRLRIDQQESRKGNIRIITWEPAEEQEDMPAIKEYTKQCEIKQFNYVLTRIRSEMQPGNDLKLSEAGVVLFNNFVERKFYEKYKDVEEMYITTRMVNVPWELVKSDEEETPWGVKYSMGIQIRSSLDAKRKFADAYKEHIDVLLIASDPLDDLRSVEQEVKEIKEKLLNNKRIRCEIIMKSPPPPSNDREKYFDLNYNTVLDKIRDKKFDIIHYAGHIDEPDGFNSGSSLILGKKKKGLSDEVELVKLYSQTIRENLGGSPFVFLNGCGIMWENSEDTTVHIADGFVLGGAKGVLVPRTKIEDQDAKSMAIGYYEKILSGQSFGQALRKTREEEYNKKPSNINWITYTLFGKPHNKLFSIQKEIFLTSTEYNARIINEAIFKEESIHLLKLATHNAYMSGVTENVETKHLFAALTESLVLATIYAPKAEDDLWKVMRDLRTFFKEDGKQKNSVSQKMNPDQMLLKEERFSEEVINVIKRAHFLCEKATMKKIRDIDICKALLEVENDEIDSAVKAINDKWNFGELTSLKKLLEVYNQANLAGVYPESLTSNLFNIDGKINMNLFTKPVNRILINCAYLFHQYRKKISPVDVFYIASLVPGSKTSDFFATEKFEYNGFVEDVKKLLLSKGDQEIILNAEEIGVETEELLKETAKNARWDSTKVGEKELMQIVVEHARNSTDEKFPPSIFLNKLLLETTDWN